LLQRHHRSKSNAAPTASNVAITGSLLLGAQLTATYSYEDIESNPESGSTFRWQRASDGAGTGAADISGATSVNYTQVAADFPSYLRVGVTPSDGVNLGPEVFSAWVGVAANSPIVSTNVLAWYDPSNLATLFQNTAGTTPVTTSGQTVDCFKDPLGIGPNQVQITPATYDVLYTVAGAEKFLDTISSGAGNGFTGSMTSLNGKTQATAIIAFVSNGLSNDYAFAAVNVTASYAQIGVRVTNANSIAVFVENVSFTFTTTNLFAAGSKVLCTVLVDFNAAAGDEVRCRINGVEYANVDAHASTQFTTQTRLDVAGVNGNASADMNFYGLVIADQALSGANLTHAEQWYASKLGITL
jgi:hypothetical protein